MVKNDAELIRNLLATLEENDLVQEQKPMNWMAALKLQATKAFTRGADTQLWIGNYANSIYNDWMSAADPDATGEDFIGWYSKSPQTSSVERIEDSFIRRIVYKATQGKLEAPLTKEQVGQIAKDLATVTGRQALGMTHKLTSASTPEQRQKAIDVLQQLTPALTQKINSGGASLNWIAKNLVSQHKFPPAVVRFGFSTFKKSLKVPLPHLSSISTADKTPLTSAQVSSLIPVMDDLILSVVLADKARQTRNTPPVPPPSDPDRVPEIVKVINDLKASGLTDDQISQALNIIFGSTS